MLALSPSIPSSSSSIPSRELAIARSLLSLLEESIAIGDLRSAGDLSQQLTEHLRGLDVRFEK